MRLGVLLAAGLGGAGCAEFDEWVGDEHTAEYRRGEVQRDDRALIPPAPEAAAKTPTQAGLYQDK
jgi:hypothetical protein